MKTLKQLEGVCLDAHRRGTSWVETWGLISKDVEALEPISLSRHRRLAAKLMHLVLTGDEGGRVPVGTNAPWIEDDLPAHDTATQARYQGTLPLTWQGAP